MKTCSLRGWDSQETAYSGPDGWCELCPPPLSEFRVAGTPNLKIKVKMEALTQTSVETKDKGTASGQQVVQSLLGCMKSFD